MTTVAEARTTLHGALVADLAAMPWRVHRVSPAQLVAPCVYLDAVELAQSDDAGAAVVVATFPVVIVHDGTVRRQVEGLDDLLARVWTACLRVSADPVGSRPVSLDVGGPSLRAHVVRAEVQLVAVTICPPTLTPAHATNGGG